MQEDLSDDLIREDGEGRQSWFSWVCGISYSVHVERVLRGKLPNPLPVSQFTGQHLSKVTRLSASELVQSHKWFPSPQ